MDGEKLIAQNRRHGKIELSPTTPDMFRGDRWFLRAVAFERDDAGTVASKLVSAGDRARNLRFERQTGDRPQTAGEPSSLPTIRSGARPSCGPRVRTGARIRRADVSRAVQVTLCLHTEPGAPGNLDA